jgi:Fungal specific transcription factor domain
MQNVYPHQAYVDPFGSNTFSSIRPTSDNISQPIPIPLARNGPPYSSGSPTLRDILLPGTDMNSPPPPMEPRPPQSPLPYIPSGYTPPDGDDVGSEDEDVEEIVRTDDPAMNLDPRARLFSNNWSIRLSSASPSPSESSSSSTSSAMDLWSQPRLRPNSQEMLLLQFDRHTCGILSVKDGPNENPWRTVVWPLALESKPLYHAVASMTAFHNSKASPELRVDGMRHMHKSVTKLATTLNNMKFDDRSNGNELEAALATTLVLAFGESWDQHTSTGIKHLKGAKYFVNQAVVKHQNKVQEGRQNSQQSNRLKFLCNSFIYMDVLARLTSLEEDDFADLDKVLATFSEPFDNLTEIDPLMGAASTLFPLIGRVAAIVTRVRTSDENSFTLISDAIELRKKIEQWQAPALGNFEVPEDPTSEVQHSLQTAEAYRWATLLHLHQAVPEIPSDTAAVLADRVLKYLATVPLSSRAIIVQIFPLLAASCEAMTQEDRYWVKNRWAAMSARMWIGNVDKCFEVIKEVWERRDAFESDKADRFLRRQAARGLTSNGLFSPFSVQGTKRKTSNGDGTDSDVFFHGPAGSGSASIGSGSFSKRRAMTDQNGMPEPIMMDDPSMAASTYMDHYQRAAMQPPQLPMQSPLPLQSPSRRKSSDKPFESIEPEYTVRGRLHWMGVMSDHKWEGGCFVLDRSTWWADKILMFLSASWMICCPSLMLWQRNNFDHFRLGHAPFCSCLDHRLVWQGMIRGLQCIAPNLSHLPVAAQRVVCPSSWCQSP